MCDSKEEELLEVIRKDQNKMLGQLQDDEMDMLFYMPYPSVRMFQEIEAVVAEALKADV